MGELEEQEEQGEQEKQEEQEEQEEQENNPNDISVEEGSGCENDHLTQNKVANNCAENQTSEEALPQMTGVKKKRGEDPVLEKSLEPSNARSMSNYAIEETANHGNGTRLVETEAVSQESSFKANPTIVAIPPKENKATLPTVPPRQRRDDNAELWALLSYSKRRL